MSQAIDQVARPGDMVASLSPGDIFQTNVTPFPGFENPFALAISEKLTAQQRTRYHIPSPAEIEGDFATHTPRIVVLRNQVFSATTGKEETLRMQRITDGFRSSLLAHGYTLVRSMGGISIYVSSATTVRPGEQKAHDNWRAQGGGCVVGVAFSYFDCAFNAVAAVGTFS